VRFIETLPWSGLLLACATLGLAPFNPPHAVEKLAMLARGELTRSIDVFDLILHLAPWAFLAARGVLHVLPRRVHQPH
jgi:hypothetical protein